MRGLRSFHLVLVLVLGVLLLSALRPATEPAPPVYLEPSTHLSGDFMALDAAPARR
jgi:hypothetical protein